MASPPARFMITQRVAWRDVHTPKGALKWRWGTVAAVALSKTDDGQLAYEYLIAGGDGSMYLRWDHQLLRPSDGEVDPFREAPDDGRRRRTSRPGPRPAGRSRRARLVRTSSRGAGYSSVPFGALPAGPPTTGSGSGSSSPLTSGLARAAAIWASASASETPRPRS